MTTTRTQWIDQRVSELLLDDGAVVELIEDIQAHGGLAHKGLCAHLLAVTAAQSQRVADRALDQAAQILRAFAFLRAQREYDTRPLCP